MLSQLTNVDELNDGRFVRAWQEFVKLKYGITLLPYQIEIVKVVLEVGDDEMFVVYRRSGMTTAMRMVEEFKCKDNWHIMRRCQIKVGGN